MPNTIVNLSNIFNYQGTGVIYNLKNSISSETRILTYLKSNVPDAFITFSYRAGEAYMIDEPRLIGTARFFSKTNINKLRLPSWYENS